MKKIILFAILIIITIPSIAGTETLKNSTYRPGQLELSIILSKNNSMDLSVELIEKEKPVVNKKVYFNIINAPSKSKTHRLNRRVAFTDTKGTAKVTFFHGGKKGKYQVAAFVAGAENSPVIFTIVTRKKMWLIFLIASLLGGTMLFLFGMKIMSDSLKELGSTKLSSILKKFTSNRFSALMVGTIITAIIQSSSATTVMVVGLINSGIMQFSQSIGIILGANIGTTITAQIVAFKLTDYAIIFIGIGFILSVVPKSRKIKIAGQAILGFGILFFGIKIMSDMTKPLHTYQPFLTLMLKLKNPVLGVLIGAVFTTMIRSSSAATGVYIALSFQGLMTLEASIPLICCQDAH